MRLHIHDLELRIVIPRYILARSDFAVFGLGLIKYPTEILVCRVVCAVVVFDADPHLEAIGLLQWSEVSHLEFGRKRFRIPVAKFFQRQAELAVCKLGGAPRGLQLREAVRGPRYRHLGGARKVCVARAVENAVLGVGARLGRPLPRERAGRARGG